MVATTERLLEAREATRRLLEGVGLRNYRFDVEPREDVYEINVELEHRDAWREAHLIETPAALLSTLGEPAARDEMVARWRARLLSERAA
jgi:hypothetical protein